MSMTPGQQPTNAPAKVHLFVGNISANADPNYLRRLFAAYGSVKFVVLKEMGGSCRHGIIGYDHCDDADSAIASLHLRYCMSPQVPIIVMYRKAPADSSSDEATASNEGKQDAGEELRPEELSEEELLKPPQSGLLVSEYGRKVGAAYKQAIEQNVSPLPIPLETFDASFKRATVAPAPTDIKLPPRSSVPWSNLNGLTPGSASVGGAAGVASSPLQNTFVGVGNNAHQGNNNGGGGYGGGHNQHHHHHHQGGPQGGYHTRGHRHNGGGYGHNNHHGGHNNGGNYGGHRQMNSNNNYPQGGAPQNPMFGTFNGGPNAQGAWGRPNGGGAALNFGADSQQ